MLAFYENLLTEDYDFAFDLIKADNKLVCLATVAKKSVNSTDSHFVCLAQKSVFGIEIGDSGNGFHVTARNKGDFDFYCKRFKIKFLNNERTNRSSSQFSLNG